MKRNIILMLAILQITLLINSIPAYNYLLNQTNPEVEKQFITSNEKFNSGLKLLIGFLSIKQIGIVSAQNIEIKCCQDTCSEITFIDGETNVECENIVDTTCANVADCVLGCCYDSEEGKCSTNSPKSFCENDGGEWTTDKTCSMDKCRNGCCVFGSNVQFTTEQNCELLSNLRGFEEDFRQIWNEIECLAVAETQAEGACLFEESLCKFETQKECISDGGRFKKGYLCSHPLLGTTCEKQDHVGCAEGKNEIYWFDSCGNRENIYSSDKEISWNQGKVLSKSESCDYDSSNINCGNCNFPISKCSIVEIGAHVADGNFICKNLGCDDAPANGGKTKDRFNGEKWCLYEGAIGDGQDTVGSEHWLAECHEGEVSLVPRTSEQRSYLCQEKTIEEGGKTFTQANYIVNDATKCKSYNPLEINEDGERIQDEEKIEACENNEHCMIQQIDVDDYFNFRVCTAKYPKGADLRDGVDDNLCSSASMSCTMIYKKGILGWKCEENCDCETKEFAEKMNGLCISYGDCGSNINYLGKGTENINIIGKKGKELDENGAETEENSREAGNSSKIFEEIGSSGLAKNYVDNKNSVDGEYVGPQNIEEYLKIYGENEELYNLLGGISGATTGVIFSPGVIFGEKALLGGVASTEIGTIFGNAITWGSIFTSVGCLAAGVSAASLVAKLRRISGPEAIVLFIAGGVTGTGAGILTLFGFGFENAWNVIGWSLLITGTITVLAFLILGIGERETRVIEFECQPWEAPNGGNDCDKCDDDSLIPCTKYKCESLGQLCKLLNEDDEENLACVSMEKESNPPILSAGKFIKENYNFKTTNFVDKTIEVEECIESGTPIVFTLNSDEYARCKYSFEMPSSPYYTDFLGELPLKRNLFSLEHTFGFNMPGIDEEFVENGELTMYIKCRDGQEPTNFNPDTYNIKFCIKSSPDQTAVDFNQFFSEPKNGEILKYGTTETNLKIWLPENSECSYDINDKPYETMSHQMACGIEDFFGWPCETKLENLIEGENKFYIRCVDEKENTNQEGYVYEVSVSESELQIDSIELSSNIQNKKITISPGESFTTNIIPISVEAKIETSGGAEKGKATCEWGVEESGGRWLMSPYDILANTHSQIIPKSEGYQTIYFECKDKAGNIAEKNSEFNIKLDYSPIIVTRVYKDGSNLKLITNEEAKCYYDTKSCYFNLEKGTPITTTFSKTHSTTWNAGINYYIKCEDLFGNINPGCAIEVTPSN